MATIKPIEGRTIHQIQSGQVIVDLCSVVKELVENSLDASATIVDVRFKNQGLEAIEVQDNGHGIPPQNYETLALKHHTSKLATYSDLATLQTFGFRGEALSSLCAVSRLSVTTCMSADVPKGTRLEFEVSGKLKGTSVAAAQRGTTVTVENLFCNLPVRRQELERSVKREWIRVVAILGQYACIQTGIKFSVSSQAAKGRRTTLFSTKGNTSTWENIVNVFGAKTLSALIPLDLNLNLEPTSGSSQRRSTYDDRGRKEIRLTGHVSRPTSSESRQLPDRQMFFVNFRPCGLPQFTKAFNEVYKSYNAAHSPFIFANIELDTHLYDVNVSPDKRTILLHDQNRMLENLKSSLTGLFELQDHKLPISQIPMQKQLQNKQLTISGEKERRSITPQNTAHCSDSDDSAGKSTIHPPTSDQEKSENHFTDDKTRSDVRHSMVSRDSMDQDREATNLISNYIGRKVVDRPNADANPGKMTNQTPNLLQKWKAEEDLEEADMRPPSHGAPASNIATSQRSHAAVYEPAVPVTDFNKRSAELGGMNASLDAGSGHSESGPTIPALMSPPSMMSSGVSGATKVTTLLPRSPSTLATVTVGDHTVTSFIGGHPSKSMGTDDLRPRNYPGKSKMNSSGTTLPSFGCTLSQRFSAPGTQQQVPDGDGDLDETALNSAVVSDQLSFKGLGAARIPSEISRMQSGSEELSGDILSPDTGTADSIAFESENPNNVLEGKTVQELIENAEQATNISPQESVVRTKALLKGGTQKKESTVGLVALIDTNILAIEHQFTSFNTTCLNLEVAASGKAEESRIESADAEDKLSLTISKVDFARMRIIGQFNLGFILATRTSNDETNNLLANDLFIIDQHASDEKYNFERLQANTILQSQRLVHPKILDLTAIEEEVVMNNLEALESNGFIVRMDHSGDSPVGKRCHLVSLPLSRETIFSTEDLDELLALLSDYPAASIPRPSKVRKMFAMRACRSSIMIGRTLTQGQMEKVVKHMGEIDKPWNCPHGRPTMRHLCGLGVWNEQGWREGCLPNGTKHIAQGWAEYIRRNETGRARSRE